MHRQLKWVLLASSLAALGGGMLTPFYAVYVADIGGDLLAAGGTAAVFGIATGIGISAYYRFYTRYIEDDHAASEWGAWDAISYVARGASALLGAYVVNRLGFDALFLVMFGVAFAGLCLIVFALEEPPRTLAEAG